MPDVFAHEEGEGGEEGEEGEGDEGALGAELEQDDLDGFLRLFESGVGAFSLDDIGSALIPTYGALRHVLDLMGDGTDDGDVTLVSGDAMAVPR